MTCRQTLQLRHIPRVSCTSATAMTLLTRLTPAIVGALLLAGCASAPIARISTSVATADSPANGTWSGPIRCSAPGARSIEVMLDEVEIDRGWLRAADEKYSFNGRFDGNGAGHIVGLLRARGGQSAPVELEAGIQDGQIVGSGRYEFTGLMPGARDGAVTRQGRCSAQLARIS
jgi:hypothetical protein